MHEITARRIESLFTRVATAAPHAVAIEDRGRTLTYDELDRRSDELAQALADGGVVPGTLVGLRLPRGLDVIVGILAIWKRGCGYVPIDLAYPAKRQQYIVRDVGLAHVLVHDDHGELRLDFTEDGAGAAPAIAEDVAYVIYTSGSTGDPKGVVVCHENVLALLDATDSFAFGPADTWTLFHSHCFDFSVWETLGALLTGGRVVIVAPEATTDAAAFVELLASHGVTVLNQVPSVFGYLVGALEARPVALPRLRTVIFGGEAIRISSLLAWRRLALAPQAELYNMYGITEITIHGTLKRLDLDELERPSRGTPIGTPLRHLRMALLDEERPVAVGTPGEIVVSGTGLAWGYLGRPELTAERFPRLAIDGERWYRTGDHAIRRDDGELEYLGRLDDQVKLRGFRIETGEIEVALSRQPDVREAAVVLADDGRQEPFLAACYVPSRTASKDLARLLREALTAELPRHMVPTRWLALPQLPQNVSGKLDSALLRRLVVETGAG